MSQEPIMFQSTVSDNMTASDTSATAIDLYHEAYDLWLWLHREHKVSWITAALAMVDLDRRYTNPTLTNRDAIAVCRASIAEAHMWIECAQRQAAVTP